MNIIYSTYFFLTKALVAKMTWSLESKSSGITAKITTLMDDLRIDGIRLLSGCANVYLKWLQPIIIDWSP